MISNFRGTCSPGTWRAKVRRLGGQDQLGLHSRPFMAPPDWNAYNTPEQYILSHARKCKINYINYLGVNIPLLVWVSLIHSHHLHSLSSSSYN